MLWSSTVVYRSSGGIFRGSQKHDSWQRGLPCKSLCKKAVGSVMCAYTCPARRCLKIWQRWRLTTVSAKAAAFVLRFVRKRLSCLISLSWTSRGITPRLFPTWKAALVVRCVRLSAQTAQLPWRNSER